MTELLTAAQMRAIEQAAIEAGEVTGLELMERAGQGVVEAIFEEWPELAKSPGRAVVLCGPGNNGGDGFVLARMLRDQGWEVEVFLYGDSEKLPPDARANYEKWRVSSGSSEVALCDLYDARIADPSRVLEADVVVDALFGTGLTRPLEWVHNEVWGAFDLDGGPICRLVAVDIPSGVCADSGRVLRDDNETPKNFGEIGLPLHALQAALTVTFHRAKVGHYL